MTTAPAASAAVSAKARFAKAGHTPRFAPWEAKTPEIARFLVERYGDGQEPRKSLDELQALLRRLRLVHYDWRRVVDADRLDVAWVLWEGPHPPAEHEAFLINFLAWLEEPQRRYQVARLALTWAAGFDPQLRSIGSVASWLEAHRDWLPEPWPQLAADFDIFSVERAPLRIASAFLEGGESANQFLARLRLPLRAVKGGLGLEILAAAAAALKERGEGEPRLALRLCALASADARLRFSSGAIIPPRLLALSTAVAEALLLPWQLRAPPADAKRVITAFLLEHYGDARVAPERWRDVQAPAAGIMRHWLTAESIAAYFRLARQARAADAKQLREREKFWLSNSERVDDAWLLTAPASRPGMGMERMARGRLGGCQPDQVALLLRLGGLTILEASNDKSEIVWRPNSPFAPRLFPSDDKVHWPGTLTRGADFSSAFDHNDGSVWQERLARFITLHSAAC